MKIAALYDIHGNLPALDAVLNEVSRSHVDLVVVGGDMVPGPMPREVIERLTELPLPVEFIRGNCEVAVLEQMAGRAPAGVPEQYRDIISWTARELSGYQPFLAGLRKTFRLNPGEPSEVLFCHGTPRDENEVFTRATAEERLIPVFEHERAGIVVCGHTHMQFDRLVGSTRILNAGSVGMPFGRTGADWLLLGPGVQFMHTDYDLACAANEVRSTRYPDASNFAETSILRPPGEQQMIQLFSRGELAATPAGSK